MYVKKMCYFGKKAYTDALSNDFRLVTIFTTLL